MPDRDYRTLPLTFERGLVETVEDSMLPPGACAKCQNWAPDPSGNLRVRRGWLKGSTTSAPTAGARKGIGIGYFSRLITPSVVQQSDAVSVTGDGSDATLTPLWKKPTTSHNLLVLVASTALNSTFNTPAGWTLAVNQVGGTNPSISIFYKANASSESGTVSVTAPSLTATEAFAAQLFELSGIALTSPLDKTAKTNGTTTTPASGTTAATAQAVEACIAVLSDHRLEDQTSATNSFQQLSQHQHDAGEDLTMGVYFKTTTATGTQNTAVTTSTSDAWAGAIVTFKGWFTSTPVTNQTTSRFFLTANNETTEIEIYKITADDLSAGTWSSVEAVTATPSIFPVAFAPGLGRIFYTHPNFISLRSWDGESVSGITDAPAGRCVAVHKSRVFVGGSTAAPSTLFFSETGDYDNWTEGTAGSIPVGEGDGEPIEDIAPFEDGLVIGKKTSLWFLTGSGPDNHRLIRLPSQTGVAPGRTITPTPYGAILAGSKNLMIFSGGSVTTYSGAIVESYGLTGDWMSGAIVNDFYYCLDQGSGTIWVLDLTEGVWHIEKIGTGNLLSANQADLGTDSSGWAAEQNCGIARGVGGNNGAGADGYLVMTSSAAGDMVASTSLSRISVAGGRTYTALCSFFPNSGSTLRQCYVDLQFWDASGNFISGNASSQITEVAGVYTQASVTVQAPINAVKAGIIAVVLGTAAGGEVHVIDGASIHEGTSTTWGRGGENASVLYNYDDTILFTPSAAFTGSLLQYRLEPGSVRQKDYSLLSQIFEAWTPEMWPVGPEEKITPRHLWLKLRQRNGDAGDAGLVITPVFDGRTQTARTITPNASAGVYWKHISIGEERGISSVLLKFTQTVPDGDTVLFDIEEATLGFDIEKKAGR